MAKVWTVGEIVAMTLKDHGPVEAAHPRDLDRAPDHVVERVRARIEARLAAEDPRAGS